MPPDHIEIRNAHQNNLKNLDLDIPLNRMTVITFPYAAAGDAATIRREYRNIECPANPPDHRVPPL